jgi:glutamate-1-semialdehyde 2,1-aminomutase
MDGATVERARVAELKRREDERFAAEHPRSLALLARARTSMPNGVPMSWLGDPDTYDHPPVWVTGGSGARFRDVDGREYVDFNIADMSMFCGYAPAPIVDAVSRRIAAGNQFRSRSRIRSGWPRSWPGGGDSRSGSSRCRPRRPTPR